jgi:hypothetical protein
MKNLIKILIVVIIGVATNENGFSTVPITTIITQTVDNSKTVKMENEIEIWKDIEDYEGLYQISNLGIVKSLSRVIYDKNGKYRNVKERILKQSVTGKDYLFVGLHKDAIIEQLYVHRLVGLYFIPNPENKPFINHKDGIKAHCYESNLEWSTHQENIDHAWQTGLMRPPWVGKFGKDNPGSKKIDQYSISGDYIDTFFGIKEASRNTGVHRNGISMVCLGKRNNAGGFIWKYAV